jgi:pyrimidine deaminase RibD-like protein
VLPSEKLERFILGFGLEISADGAGRPTTLPDLLVAAQQKCGDCKMEELVDALYNLGDEHVELLKFLPNGRPARFSRHRNRPQWRLFFNGSFNIKVLPKGRVRFEKLSEEHDYNFARRAIEEARKSISECDGKPRPRVGAVVVKDGRIVATGYRGERPANHAEYIALEQKLPEEVAAGSTVYTTLEPCTTRNHPKIPCAERLIERRVKRVFIGMLDPNPQIQGHGVRKLREAGIIVQLFPDDLQAEVEELNREFSRFYKSAESTQPVRSGSLSSSSTPRPLPTRKIDNRIVEAKCSECNEPLDLGNDVGNSAEQEQKMHDVFLEHTQEKHRVQERGRQNPPMTPRRLAEMLKAEEQFQLDKARMNSENGIKEVHRSIDALFQEIKRQCSDIKNGGMANIYCGIDSNEGQMTQMATISTGTVSISIVWNQLFGNDLKDAELTIREFKGRVSLPMDVSHHTFRAVPFRELAERSYSPDLSRAREYGWKQKGTSEFVSSPALAEQCVMKLMELATLSAKGQLP